LCLITHKVFAPIQITEPNTIADDFKILYNDIAEAGDTTFNLQGEYIKFHKIVLAAKSQGLAALLRTATQQGSISVLEYWGYSVPYWGPLQASSFSAVLKYCYYCESPSDPKDAAPLMKFAEDFSIQGLQKACKQTINQHIKSRELDPNIAIGVLVQQPSMKNKLTNIVKKCERLLMKRIGEDNIDAIQAIAEKYGSERLKTICTAWKSKTV